MKWTEVTLWNYCLCVVISEKQYDEESAKTIYLFPKNILEIGMWPCVSCNSAGANIFFQAKK